MMQHPLVLLMLPITLLLPNLKMFVTFSRKDAADMEVVAKILWMEKYANFYIRKNVLSFANLGMIP